MAVYAKEKGINPSRIFFDSPELLDIQRSGFNTFLKHGIAAELSKKFPIKIKSDTFSVELVVNEKTVRLVAPENNPQECLVKMKTYSSKLYVQAKLTWRNLSGKIVHQTKPEWVLLGQLPMITKRGHFILNGSPRVIVHQVVRSPGIYFQKLLKKDDKNRARFYGDIIPVKGVWVRLQITKKGRVELRFKKGKRVQVELVQKCLNVMENRSIDKNTPSRAPGESKVFALARDTQGVQVRLDQYKRLHLKTQKSSPLALAQELSSFSCNLKSYSTKRVPCSVIKSRAQVLCKPTKDKDRLYARTPKRCSVHTSKIGSQYKAPTLFRVTDSCVTPVEKKTVSLDLLAEHDAFVDTYDKLYRTAEDKELEEWQRKKLKKSRTCLKKRLNKAVLQGKQHSKSCVAYGFVPEKGFKRKKCFENLYATFKNSARYDLGELGREKINAKLGLSLTCTQLTAVDLVEASNWLTLLRKGERKSDDIDDSQNRRVRSSGHLLHTQFENGVDRLKKLLRLKLKELNNSVLDTKKRTRTQLFGAHPRNRPASEHFGVRSLAWYGRTRNKIGFKRSFWQRSCDVLSRKKQRIRSTRTRESTFSRAGKKVVRNLSCKKRCTRLPWNISEGNQRFIGSKTEVYVKDLFSTKPITGAMREFFGSNPLSQYMDQTNPLAEITHKRRMSSLGVGGISRESAGMAIRGIHPTHYGRICPIETPEGKNAGLVNSLAFYTKIGKDGFLETPYYRVCNGQIQTELGFTFCSAKKESIAGVQIGPSDLQQSVTKVLRTDSATAQSVPVRVADSLLDVFQKTKPVSVQCVTVSPIQMISVATSLIPFLEHNDANRALMGSNMQRQAVPLMISERPIVGTGLETRVVVESGHVTQSEISGFVSNVTSNQVVVEHLGERNKKNFPFRTNLSLLAAYKPNLMQETLFSPRMHRRGSFTETRVHRCAVLQDKSFGVHSLSKSVCLSKRSLQNLPSLPVHCVYQLKKFQRSNQNTCITEKPLVYASEWVQKGDVITDCSASDKSSLAVGKNITVAYIPWDGYNFEDAIVVSERLVKEHVYTSVHIEKYVFVAKNLKDGHEWFTKYLPGIAGEFVNHLEESGLPKIGSFLREGDILVGKISYLTKKPTTPYERLLFDILGEKSFKARNKSFYMPKGMDARVIHHRIINFFQSTPASQGSKVNQSEKKAKASQAYLSRPPKTVQVFLGEKRVIQVGDKMSGRHGNKGVISTILPRQDMPYLPDGTPIDIVLNPLGVPSRMNVGQVLESLLGLSSTYLSQHFKITSFDELYGVEASKSLVYLKLYQARLHTGQNWLFHIQFPGKTRVFDGRSGECFDQWITVGKAYILKLIHMVSEKIHARSTGPYALITQQPLRGRSNKGGQRLGEMEVWAFQGFGAAYSLQELLTNKSDDFFGRKQVVDSILPDPLSLLFSKSNSVTSEADTAKQNRRLEEERFDFIHQPEIFKVLLCELQALCLDLGVYILQTNSFQRTFLGVVN